MRKCIVAKTILRKYNLGMLVLEGLKRLLLCRECVFSELENFMHVMNHCARRNLLDMDGVSECLGNSNSTFVSRDALLTY